MKKYETPLAEMIILRLEDVLSNSWNKNDGNQGTGGGDTGKVGPGDVDGWNDPPPRPVT